MNMVDMFASAKHKTLHPKQQLLQLEFFKMNTIQRQVGQYQGVQIEEIQGIFQKKEVQTKRIQNIFQGMG